MRVEPITCYRPTPQAAGAVAAPPYDVFDRTSATAYVAAHPGTFLEVDRPETAFAPDHDPYADDVYAHAHDVLAARADEGTLLRDGTPCFYLWRMRSATGEQVGIAAAFSVDDYTNGIIRRHELTRRDKEDDRLRHIEATTCQTGPVMLAYRDNPVLEALVAAASTAEPLYDFRAAGVRHTLWRVSRPAAVESIRLMLEHVDRAYIVDGHHRAAAAARFCQKMRTSEGASYTGDEAYNYFLGVLFPASQLTCLPYDRVVADTAGLSEDGLVAALEAAGVTVGARQEGPVRPSEPLHVGMYAFGAWRELALPEAAAGAGVAARLDASVLQERVLAGVLGVGDPREDARLRFFGGGDATALERAADGCGVAFSLRAVTTDELMATADAGELMPPKSTWFEPKVPCGLLVRRVCLRECLIDGARSHRHE